MYKHIVIEGPDRIGKSTIIKEMIKSGLVSHYFNFPRKDATNPLSSLMQNVLTIPSFHSVHPSLKALLFSVDRYQLKESLGKALDHQRPVIVGLNESFEEDRSRHEKQIILCDRYTYSNLAFQIGSGVILGLSDEELIEIGELIRYLEYDIFKMPKPDLIISFTASSDSFIIKRRESLFSEENDLNDTSAYLQLSVNRFFKSNDKGIKANNLDFWEKDVKQLIIDVTDPDNLNEFKKPDLVFNEVMDHL